MYYHNIYHIKSIFILEMGDDGGNLWGRPPPTRFYLEAIERLWGNRPQRGFIRRVIEKVVAGY
jgi:hypothetical protein